MQSVMLALSTFPFQLNYKSLPAPLHRHSWGNVGFSSGNPSNALTASVGAGCPCRVQNRGQKSHILIFWDRKARRVSLSAFVHKEERGRLFPPGFPKFPDPSGWFRVESEHKVPQPWQGLSPCPCHSHHSATRITQSVPLSSSGQCPQSPAKLKDAGFPPPCLELRCCRASFWGFSVLLPPY